MAFFIYSSSMKVVRYCILHFTPAPPRKEERRWFIFPKISDSPAAVDLEAHGFSFLY